MFHRFACFFFVLSIFHLSFRDKAMKKHWILYYYYYCYYFFIFFYFCLFEIAVVLKLMLLSEMCVPFILDILMKGKKSSESVFFVCARWKSHFAKIVANVYLCVGNRPRISKKQQKKCFTKNVKFYFCEQFFRWRKKRFEKQNWYYVYYLQ